MHTPPPPSSLVFDSLLLKTKQHEKVDEVEASQLDREDSFLARKATVAETGSDSGDVAIGTANNNATLSFHVSLYVYINVMQR